MKKTLTLVFLGITTFCFGQNELVEYYQKASKFLEKEDVIQAYQILSAIEPKCPVNDTLYEYILWDEIRAAWSMEMDYRAKEDYQNSVKYSLELLNLINKGKLLFSEEFIKREYWVRKNLVVAYNGLGQPAKAQEHKEYLYRAYKNKLLPEGIDEFFNYRFFKMGDKNIWAYEWFEELPKDRFSKSFTKVVYYIYSTNPDGSDKDQLYRLHVLMFHGTDVKFDYVLTKKIDTPNGEVGGTLYQYVYNEDIDYAKLEADVRQVVASDQEPDTKSFRKK